ncbi:MAG TPA: hypothetical protein VL172_10905, partial [Kofleriaceae bacterium]|nr:hypothetical protein [Kofleriaceae bacterium]
ITVGEALGDPLKDSCAPALSSLIKTMALVALALAPWLAARAAGLPPGDAGLRVRVQPSRPESTLSGRRVRHKVFGEGRLLKEIGTGPDRKVQVDFPRRGLVLLQAKFLEFLD